MRLAKLCITLALALGGWHEALASALCARRADCHVSASPRTSHAHESPSRPTESIADDKHHAATPADADLANRHGHCGTPAQSQGTAAHAGPHDAETVAARAADENASYDQAADLRAPDSPCEHCVGRQTDQPARVNSVAPAFARDAHAAPVPTRQLAALTPHAPRPRFAPTQHAPPRGRPLHLLNSALLI